MSRKKDNRHKIIGGRHRAESRYSMILNRLKDRKSKKNLCYSGIEVRISKDDFCEWFMVRDFEGCSVDRIDSKGHYETGNIRLIPLASNIAREKLKSIGGMCECYSCKITKPLDEFAKDNRRISTGRTTICKLCDNKRSRDRYHKSGE